MVGPKRWQGAPWNSLLKTLTRSSVKTLLKSFYVIFLVILLLPETVATLTSPILSLTFHYFNFPVSSYLSLLWLFEDLICLKVLSKTQSAPVLDPYECPTAHPLIYVTSLRSFFSLVSEEITDDSGLVCHHLFCFRTRVYRMEDDFFFFFWSLYSLL